MSSRAEAATVIIESERAAFSSGFFFGNPALRGHEANSASTVLGVSAFPYGPGSDAFGLAPEVTFFGFSLSQFENLDAASVVSVTFEATTVFRNFQLPVPSGSNPVSINARGVSADPFSVIVSTASRNAFYSQSLLPPDAAAATVVSGEGLYGWDVTPLVEQWLNDPGAVPVLAMTGEPNGNFLHGFRNPGAFDPPPGINPRLVIQTIPEPRTAAICAAGIILLQLRRRMVAPSH